MGLIVDELGQGPVALDTAVFIYFIEENPRYLPLVEPLFSAVARGELEAVTSELTLLEVLVVPYRRGDDGLADRYEAFLSRSRGLRLLEIDRSVMRAAARIRATTGMGTPDSIQLATALSAGCTHLVTNDRDLQRVGGMEIIQLGDRL